MLAVTEDMVSLAEGLITEKVLSPKAIGDALHIAIATLHGIDFFLTWNCRHIANPIIQEKIAAFLERKGLFLPTICTPEELLGAENDE
jgi:hypothetical protein